MAASHSSSHQCVASRRETVNSPDPPTYNVVDMRPTQKRPCPRRTAPSSRSFTCAFLLLLCASLWRPVAPYKIGSPVPLIIHTPTDTVDALRSQMPLFGVPTSASIGTDVLKPAGSASADSEAWKRRLSVSLSFGGGAGATFGERSVSAPWADVFPPGKVLERLTVTFVYCRDGDLHGVSSKASYVDLTKADEDAESHFRVEYVWVEEADVDLAGGVTVMMGLVLLASMVILVGACADMSKLDKEEQVEEAVGYGTGQDYGYGGYTGGSTWKGE